MKWASALSNPDSAATLAATLSDCCQRIQTQLAGRQPDFVVGFVSPHFMDSYEDVPYLIGKELAPKTFIGCSAGGLIGEGLEIEQGRAVALTAACLPDVEIKSFYLETDDLPDLDSGPEQWEKLANVKSSDNPSFILLPDPFSFNVDTLVQGLDFAFPKAITIGGLASGANQLGMNVLFENDQVFCKGLVGVALYGNVVVEAIVAQGCRPVGWPMRVTQCKKNVLFELDGKPAVVALQEVLEALSVQDQELARNSLFIGVVMNEFQDIFKPGDFLIRNIFGVEPQTGALIVGELLRAERTVQFHIRDAATSADDLRFLLKSYCDKHQRSAMGALLFSCLGRGQHLYGIANHDSDCFKEYMGEIPLGGFFCNGEIGPIGGTTFLHGYTSSFGIFRTKETLKV